MATTNLKPGRKAKPAGAASNTGRPRSRCTIAAMRTALLILALSMSLLAQYNAPNTPGAAGATGPAGPTGPSGSAASSAISPWVCKPTSANGAAYDCSGTGLTLADGTVVTSPVPGAGQLMTLIPDISSTGGFTIRVDGVNDRSARNYTASNFSANDVLINKPTTFAYQSSTNRWIFQSPIVSFAANGGITNSGTVIAPNFVLASPVAPTLFGTATNCSSSASPAVCAAAAAGSVVVAAAATTVVVNTSAVTANSQIFLMYDSSLGTKLSVTCNATEPALYGVTARTAATSFTITATSPITNPACFSYFIIN